jgi:biotin carboxyl carrier protein
LLTLWLGTPQLDTPDFVYARTPAPNEAPGGKVEQTTVPNVSSATVPAPEISVPQPEPVPAVASPVVAPQAVAPQAASANIPPASPKPKEQTPLNFRLSGIFYTSVRPSAIVDGLTVRVGDQVSDATVIAIGPTYVTLESKGRRKTCILR